MKTRLLIVILIGLSVVGIFGGLHAINMIKNIGDQKAQEEWRDLRESIMGNFGKQKKM